MLKYKILRVTRILMLLLAVGGILSSVNASQFDFRDVKTIHARQYVKQVHELGFDPRVENGNVMFEYQGWPFILTVSENDPFIFSLVMPGVWGITDVASRLESLQVIADINATLDGSRLYIEGTEIRAAVDGTLDSYDDFPAVLALSARKNFELWHAFRLYKTLYWLFDEIEPQE